MNLSHSPFGRALDIRGHLDSINFRFSSTVPPLLTALDQLGFQTPTPIQQRSLPLLMEGDLLGIAQTGTGKTAAFALPMLNAIQDKGLRAAKKRPLALILAPTRELASQIFEDIRQYSQETSIRSTCIFGGAIRTRKSDV